MMFDVYLEANAEIWVQVRDMHKLWWHLHSGRTFLVIKMLFVENKVIINKCQLSSLQLNS